MTIELKTEKDTENLAKDIAQKSSKGSLICLYGELGTGKTTFSRYFIQSLCNQTLEIPSPTFTLLQTYISQTGIPIYHYDFYRLKKTIEIFELDIEEALTEGITLIEWPEIAEQLLPKTNRTNLYFSLQNNKRILNIKKALSKRQG